MKIPQNNSRQSECVSVAVTTMKLLIRNDRNYTPTSD